MQRAFVSAAARAGLALLVVLVLPNALVLASSDYVITPSGQRISGIFEGLRPSAFMLKYARRRSSARREKWFLDERKLDAHLGAQLALACVNSGCQPDTLCADHYQKFDDSSGCIESPPGACPLPLKNATTDTTAASYSQGAYDSFCGLYCCEDAQECPNP